MSIHPGVGGAVRRSVAGGEELDVRYIVEFEGGGADRVELYGEGLIGQLSSERKGTSQTNLRKFRESYQGWGPSAEQLAKIQQTVSVRSFQGVGRTDLTPLLGDVSAYILALARSCTA